MIHFFTKGDRTTASSRQRAFLLAEALAKRGVPTRVHAPGTEQISTTPWPKKLSLIFQTFHAFRMVKKDDVIFLQRTVYNKYFFVIAVFFVLFFRRTMIFDIDDAVYVHIPWKTAVLATIASIVFVGNHVLEAWAKKYNTRVLLVPTCTDFGRVKQEPFFSVNGGKPLTLGWVGNGPAHIENLMFLRQIFFALSAKSIPCTFILVGAKKSEKIYALFANIPGVRVEYIEWSGPESIPAMIDRFDLGLMPLVDTPWNRGKCAMKIIEYMACGVPALASPVGENTFVIRDGINGLLVSTIEQWVKAIERIYQSPESLASMGISARETVEKHYTFDAQVPRVLSVIQEITAPAL